MPWVFSPESLNHITDTFCVENVQIFVKHYQLLVYFSKDELKHVKQSNILLYVINNFECMNDIFSVLISFHRFEH